MTSQADAIVSVGNANERITLPPMEMVLGDIRVVEKLAGGRSGSLSPKGLQVELQAILGATNELGFERLRARGQ